MDLQEQQEIVDNLVDRFGLSRFGENYEGVTLFFDDDAQQYMDDVIDALYRSGIDYDIDGDAHLYVRWSL
jgi:hypothetical protein